MAQFNVINSIQHVLTLVDNIFSEVCASNVEERTPFGDRVKVVSVKVTDDPRCVERYEFLGLVDNDSTLKAEMPISFSKYKSKGGIVYHTLDIKIAINGVVVTTLTQSLNEDFAKEMDICVQREAFGSISGREQRSKEPTIN